MNKNRFLTFLFSLIPGCGLLYLGYMKKGSQVMLTAIAAGLLGGFFSSYSITILGVLFFLLLPVIWFYQMFDAMHTVARMKDQGVSLPEDDGFILPEKLTRFSPIQNRTIAKVIAAILIVVGAVSLASGVLNNLWHYPGIDHEVMRIISDAVRYNLVPAIVSIVLIVVGIRLLRGGKAKKAEVIDRLDEIDAVDEIGDKAGEQS